MPKKILYIIPRFTTGGAERLVLQYAKYFQEIGFKVAVASVVGGGELKKEFEKNGIEVFCSRKKTLGNWRKLKKFYRKFSPDLIHSHVFSGDLSAYLLKRKGVKWVSTQHNVGKEHSWLRKKILKIILPKADLILAVFNSVEKFCMDKLKLNKEKVQLLKNGIELEKWSAVNGKILINKKLNLATIGRLEKQKNHEFLFKSLVNLKIDWELKIYGAGSKEKELKKIAESLKIADKIKWQGVKKDLVKELSKIDVVIQPSLWEGMSLVLMETMASGRLVLASKPAGEGLIQDEKTGFLLKDFSKEEVVGTLNKIFTQKDWVNKIAEQGRTYAKNNFDLNKHLKKMKKFYENV